MLNIVIPVGGQLFFPDNLDYPKILISIQQRPLLSWMLKSLKNLERLGEKIEVTFILLDQIEKKIGLRRILSFYSGDHVRAITVREGAMGAPCSILLAADQLDLSRPAIVSSVDQVLDFDLAPSLPFFRDGEAAAGIYHFESVHPKWSYAKIDQGGVVKEVREKTAISTTAIAGMYYFSSGELMVDAFIRMLRRNDSVQGRFFVAPAMNEIILAGQRVLGYPVDGATYFNFYDRHQIELFEQHVTSIRSENLLINRAQRYADAFAARDIAAIGEMLAPEFSLQDPNVDIRNDRQGALDFMQHIFDSASDLRFDVHNIRVAGPNETVFNFELNVGGQKFVGVDFINWSRDGLMSSLRAYLHPMS